MPKPLRSLVAIAPYSVVLGLVWVDVGSLELLNSRLAYVGRKGDLPEDIYGFGFAGVWIASLIPFLFSTAGFRLDHVIWPQITR
jgi:hypothetical protein